MSQSEQAARILPLTTRAPSTARAGRTSSNSTLNTTPSPGRKGLLSCGFFPQISADLGCGTLIPTVSEHVDGIAKAQILGIGNDAGKVFANHGDHFGMLCCVLCHVGTLPSNAWHVRNHVAEHAQFTQ